MRSLSLAAGTRVKVKTPGSVPQWSVWDDDKQRTSNPVKKRLQQLFFRGDRRISASVVYIGNESLRDRLRSRNQVKVEVRDPAGACIVILADSQNLTAA
jgi:hypothetical protein